MVWANYIPSVYFLGPVFFCLSQTFSCKGGTGHSTAVHWGVIGYLGQDWMLARSFASLATWPPASVFLIHFKWRLFVLLLALTSVSKNSLEKLGKGRQKDDQRSWFCSLENSNSSLRSCDFGSVIGHLAKWNFVH